MTSGRLSTCYRDEINDANDNDVANNRTNKNKTIRSKPFNRTRPGNGLVGLQLTSVVYIPRTKNFEALRLLKIYKYLEYNYFFCFIVCILLTSALFPSTYVFL